MKTDHDRDLFFAFLLGVFLASLAWFGIFAG